MDTSQLPPRFREEAFRRYESIITHAVVLHPARYVIPPRPGLSQETVSCRLRDAMRSLASHRWHPTTVDMPKFDAIYPTATVSHEGEDVVVAWNKRRAQPLEQVAPQLTITIQVESWLLTSICFMVEAKQVNSVLVQKPPSDWKETVSKTNVGAVLRDDGSLLIV